jgi:hypothetical protein
VCFSVCLINNLKIYFLLTELLPELMATEPRLDKSIDKIIVVDCIPKVGLEKKEKLKQILNKLLQNYGTIVNEFFPEENGITKG